MIRENATASVSDLLLPFPSGEIENFLWTAKDGAALLLFGATPLPWSYSRSWRSVRFVPFPALPGLHLVQTATKTWEARWSFPGEVASDGAVAWDTPRPVHGEATSPRELYRGDSVELIARAWWRTSTVFVHRPSLAGQPTCVVSRGGFGVHQLRVGDLWRGVFSCFCGASQFCGCDLARPRQQRRVPTVGVVRIKQSSGRCKISDMNRRDARIILRSRHFIFRHVRSQPSRNRRSWIIK